MSNKDKSPVDIFYENVEKYQQDFEDYMNNKSKRGRKRKNKISCKIQCK